MAVEGFVTTTSSAFSLAVPGDWRALDCRHGHVLLLGMVPGWAELVLWDPITGDLEHVPVLEAMWDNRAATQLWPLSVLRPGATTTAATGGGRFTW